MSIRVYLPSNNPITQGYSSTHKAYDFAGLNKPDEVRCGMNGEIIGRVDVFDSNWINMGVLTTRDYGNYIKVRHDDGTFALFAHLKKESAFVIGTKVITGQVIARIGNTGNSTGPHLHAEYRNSSNVNQPVEFYTNIEVSQPTLTITDQTKIPANLLNSKDYPVETSTEVQAIRGLLGDFGRCKNAYNNLLKDYNNLKELSSSLPDDLKMADNLTIGNLIRLLLNKLFG